MFQSLDTITVVIVFGFAYLSLDFVAQGFPVPFVAFMECLLSLANKGLNGWGDPWFITDMKFHCATREMQLDSGVQSGL